jgi:hypothetical protein
MGPEIGLSNYTFAGVYSGTSSTATSANQFATSAFADFTYGEVAFTYSIRTTASDPQCTMTNGSVNGALKVPFQIGPLVVYPLAGIGYWINLTFLDSKGNDLQSKLQLDGLWFSLGGGLDLPIMGTFFFRLEGAYVISPGTAPSVASHPTGSLSVSPPSDGFVVRFFWSWKLS